MRTPDITYKLGDRLPVLTRTFSVDGTVVDLTGFTVKFKVRTLTGTTDLVDGSCTIDPDPTTGRVTYALTALDVAALPAGTYAARFVATSATSLALTIPNDGFLVFSVVATTSAVWSYTGNPAGRSLDAVRLLINDTNPSSPKINDAELLWFLSNRADNVWWAAADAAEQLAGQYAALAGVKKQVGDLTLDRQINGAATEYRKMATALRAKAVIMNGFTLEAGGSTTVDKIFSVGMFDFPAAPSGAPVSTP